VQAIIATGMAKRSLKKKCQIKKNDGENSRGRTLKRMEQTMPLQALILQIIGTHRWGGDGEAVQPEKG